jgi:hypothetical protein
MADVFDNLFQCEGGGAAVDFFARAPDSEFDLTAGSQSNNMLFENTRPAGNFVRFAQSTFG